MVPTNGIEYKLQDDGMVVTGYTGTETNIVIASTVDGKTVKRIQASAFSGSNIQSVYIPGTVETIGDSAFSGCSLLETVKMMEGVKSIGARAFESCRSLKEVNLPVSVESLGEILFPDNGEDMPVNYGGTKAQFDEMIKSCPHWNYQVSITVVFSDGRQEKYSG